MPIKFVETLQEVCTSILGITYECGNVRCDQINGCMAFSTDDDCRKFCNKGCDKQKGALMLSNGASQIQLVVNKSDSTLFYVCQEDQQQNNILISVMSGLFALVAVGLIALLCYQLKGHCAKKKRHSELEPFMDKGSEI